MPRPDNIFRKTVSFTPDIMGPLMGKGRKNFNQLIADHPNVRITSGKDGSYPCFHLSSTSLDAVSKCERDLDKAILKATASAERRHEHNRIERERQKAKSKAEAEQQMRDNIARELEESKNRNASAEVAAKITKTACAEKVRNSNPFGALMDEDSDVEA